MRHPLFFFFLLTIHYVSCELSSGQLTTMNNLHELLQKNNNNTLSKWNSSQNLSNPCSWPGVTCSNNSAITTLSLSSFSITNSNDSWSSLICQIETLQTLDLSNNLLTSIPPSFISPCGNLKILNISRNSLTGNLPDFNASLTVLDLSYNSFDSVPISSQFEGLTELKSLNISHNSFTGSIPINIGTNPMLLEELQLSMNRFAGVIPEQITKYPNLSLLDLSGNRLTGIIPNDVGKLSSLHLLILSVNKLFGEIPQSISTIVNLKRFAANQNSFTGAIPQGITKYLRNLDLSYNSLNASIPSDLLSQPNLLTVDLSFNKLDGYIPSNVSTSLVRLRLGSNLLKGELPSWSFGNGFPSLTYLEVDHNRLSSTIPSELRLCRNLSLLDLSYNNLVGIVPPQLGDLDKLQVFQIQHNNLSGQIPNEINRLQILVKLNMSWNSFTGSIPPSISNLQNLTNLDLRVNELTGEIPDSFSAMDSLLELQLGMNKFGGEIRSLPTKLQIALNLSHNDFQGPIPGVISRLQAIEVLDLSNNRFSGGIPSFLSQMRSLTQILLSNNLLTGSIPQFGQNVVVSTDGNNLSGTTPTGNNGNDNDNDNDNNKPVSVGIIVATSTSIVVIIIVVIVALIFNSRRIHKVNNEESHLSRPQVIKSNLLTLNVIHRTNIDFTKAMEAVSYPSNIVSKTRFSTYYKADMPSGKTYLVKKVNWSDKMFQLGTHDLFEHELEIIGRLRNSSVMIPLAYTLTTENAYLFYEFVENGTLFDVLHESGLDWTNRYSIALGVANGLTFLHECPSGPIVLLDLSSKVVMLKSLNDPRIGDIELSKVIDPSKSTGNLSAIAGSVGYIPPEYAYTMRMTMAGNVYSFGVIMLELLTGKATVSEGSELAKWVTTKSKQQDDKFDQILDSTLSKNSAAIRDQMCAVLKIALTCVSQSPEARPKMKSVQRMLLNARI